MTTVPAQTTLTLEEIYRIIGELTVQNVLLRKQIAALSAPPESEAPAPEDD